MDDAGCPSCTENDGQVDERKSIEDGLKVTFECENCGHDWDVVF